MAEDGRLHALELRQLDRHDPRAAAPVVSGLFEKRADGLLEGSADQWNDYWHRNGGGRIEMVRRVAFEGTTAEAVYVVAVDDRSEVITDPPREGSARELLLWMQHDCPCQATARLEEDGTLTLVKLVGSAPPGS